MRANARDPENDFGIVAITFNIPAIYGSKWCLGHTGGPTQNSASGQISVSEKAKSWLLAADARMHGGVLVGGGRRR